MQMELCGAGLARQLADKYPLLEKNYKLFCELNFNGYFTTSETFIFKTEDKLIANIFSQKPDFYTDYNSMRECLNFIKMYADYKKYSIAIPYKIRMWYSKWRMERSKKNNRRSI